MRPIRPIAVALSTALLCACRTAPTRLSTAPAPPAPTPAWRGIAMLADPARAPRSGTLEVLLVSAGGGEVKPLAHAEFAVKPAARIEFALPADVARDDASTVGLRVWLRDASGRLRYASERIVAADRDVATAVPLSAVAPR